MTRDRGQVCLHEEKGFCGRTHPMEMLACFIIDRPGEKRVGSVLWKCHARQKYAKNTEETGSTFVTLYFMNIILPHLGGCLLGNSLCRPHSPGHRRLTLESSGAAPPLQEIAPRVVDCPSLVAKTELSSPAWGRQGRQAGRYAAAGSIRCFDLLADIGTIEQSHLDLVDNQMQQMVRYPSQQEMTRP